jgi:hypothetical protein
MTTHGHTQRDYDELIAAGVDPSTTQPREHPIPCAICTMATMHQAGRCDFHYVAPFAARRSHGDLTR